MVVVLLTAGLTRLWLRSVWSERSWTWLNEVLSEGRDPALASDVELVLALLVACATSFAAALVVSKVWRSAFKRST